MLWVNRAVSTFHWFYVFPFLPFRSRLDLSQNSPRRLVSPTGLSVYEGTDPLGFQIDVKASVA
jgi:hypothetical protein